MRNLIILFLYVNIFSTASAQLTVGFTTGLNLPTAGAGLPGFVQVEKDGTQKALIATMGGGIDFNGVVGVALHPNISAQLAFGHFSGFKGGFYQYVELDPSQAPSRIDILIKGKFTHITPSIVVQSNPDKNTLIPYARFGFILGSANTNITTTMQGASGKNVQEYSGGISKGLTAAIGIRKKLNTKTSLIAELNTKTITTLPKKLVNVENFEGMLRQPEIHFVKEIKPSSPPTDQLLTSIPYSSVGLTIGILFLLGAS